MAEALRHHPPSRRDRSQTQPRPSGAERPPTVPRLAAAAALLGAGTMLLEIGLTRLFSVLLFYHYVFLVLSLALLGLGVGAVLATMLPERRGRAADYVAGAGAAAALATVVVAALAARVLPAGTPILHGAVAMAPFLLVGMAMPLLLGARREAAGRIYGADLIGAGVGVPLALLLLYLGAATAVLGAAVLFAAAAWIAGGAGRPRRRGVAVLLGLVAALFAVDAAASVLEVDLGRLARGKPLALWLERGQATPLRSSWDPFGRVDVVHAPSNPNERVVFIDGAAGSPLPRYPTDANEEAKRRTELGSFPYRLVPAERALVIGSGGGIGVLHALLNGVDDVTAVEVSPGVVAAVRAEGDYDGYLYDRPEVRVVTDEGRAFLDRDDGRYDVIDLSLVVSLATAQSGYALTENYLFTRESFDEMLRHLTDRGILAVRLYDDPTLTRAFVTAATALRGHAASDAEAVRHLAVVFNPAEASRDGRTFYPLLLVSKRALTQQAATELTKRAADLGYTVMFAPFTQEQGPFGKVARGEASLAGIQQELRGGVFTATTDARPFFFEMTGRLPDPLVDAWIAVAVVVGLAAAGLLVSRRSDRAGASPPRTAGRELVYFAALGLGFIVVELALIAQLGRFLGHPTIVLATVLGGLLLASGAGSLASGCCRLAALPRVVALAAAVAAALAVALPVAADTLVRHSSALPLAGRVGVALALLVPLGLAMGMLFPSGLRLSGGDAPVPWAVNGVASVVGAVLATTLALRFGYPAVAGTGAAVYGAVALGGPWLLGRPYPRIRALPRGRPSVVGPRPRADREGLPTRPIRGDIRIGLRRVEPQEAATIPREGGE